MITTLPDVEALVGGWLTSHPDIAAMNARVAARTPDLMTRPWVQITLLVADDVVRGLDHLVDFTLQLDCYAGETAQAAFTGRLEAWLLASRVRAVLRSKEGTQGGGVVVTRVAVPGHARLPDTAYEPARERYVLTVDVMLHAV
jgi:hypothetical protein